MGLSVADEEGVTLTLDRFDPGRDQNGARVPSAVLPGDVLVPCVFTSDSFSEPVIQSQSELLQTFKVSVTSAARVSLNTRKRKALSFRAEECVLHFVLPDENKIKWTKSS